MSWDNVSCAPTQANQQVLRFLRDQARSCHSAQAGTCLAELGTIAARVTQPGHHRPYQMCFVLNLKILPDDESSYQANNTHATKSRTIARTKSLWWRMTDDNHQPRQSEDIVALSSNIPCGASRTSIARTSHGNGAAQLHFLSGTMHM